MGGRGAISIYSPPESPVFPEPPPRAFSPDQIIPPGMEDKDTPPPHRERGIASWYVHYSRRTASGERYNRADYTAAHRTLPFGTRVKVRNLDNGREVVVRITDRGPYVRGRIIDLSESAARAIGLLDRGIAMVEIEVVE
jgi:rare lipoprotein A